MAHFYSSIQGPRGETTREGTKSSGISAYVQSWTGRIEASFDHDSREDRDYACVVLTTGPSGSGRSTDITGNIDVAALVQAASFDAETGRHLRQAKATMQRANAAAVKACAKRDKLARKVA